MALRELTSDEKEMIAVGLNMRKCYIETGTISLGASDVSRIGAKAAEESFGAEIKALSGDQMRLILSTNDFITKMFNGKIYIDD